MAYCCVPCCKSNGRLDPSLSFHEFPVNNDLCMKWLINIDRADFIPNDKSRSSVVCSKHFKPDDFIPNLKRRRLKRNAVPSVFKFHFVGSRPPEYLRRPVKKFDGAGRIWLLAPFDEATPSCQSQLLNNMEAKPLEQVNNDSSVTETKETLDDANLLLYFADSKNMECTNQEGTVLDGTNRTVCSSADGIVHGDSKGTGHSDPVGNTCGDINGTVSSDFDGTVYNGSGSIKKGTICKSRNGTIHSVANTRHLRDVQTQTKMQRNLVTTHLKEIRRLRKLLASKNETINSMQKEISKLTDWLEYFMKNK